MLELSSFDSINGNLFWLVTVCCLKQIPQLLYLIKHVDQNSLKFGYLIKCEDVKRLCDARTDNTRLEPSIPNQFAQPLFGKQVPHSLLSTSISSSTPGVPQVSLDSPDVPLGQEGVPEHHASRADDASSSVLSPRLLRRVLLRRRIHQRRRLQVGYIDYKLFPKFVLRVSLDSSCYKELNQFKNKLKPLKIMRKSFYMFIFKQFVNWCGLGFTF